jgi:hypothetical protein
LLEVKGRRLGEAKGDAPDKAQKTKAPKWFKTLKEIPKAKPEQRPCFSLHAISM